LTFGTTGTTLQNTIIGSINTTEYWVGMFGLGIVPGNFTNVTSLSAISGLVEKDGVIPSHSYGFTAGAKYREFRKRLRDVQILTGCRGKRRDSFVDSRRI
jgi:hypothetical protein